MKNSVVQIEEIKPGIVQVTMVDRVHKNSFSDDLLQELSAAFAEINQNPRYKVVILTGYDSYFATGGTQEGLLAIQEGRTSFTEGNIYSLALDCPIPVIAAMQGHGIGGGFVMGLYADIVVLSRESLYTTNFMRYGFTPGMGATYIIQKKLGLALAEEMLLHAGNYRGAELQKKGIPFPVLPRSEVLEHANILAQSLAEKPRVSLITLKNHLVGPLRSELPAYIEKEVEMHDKTFHQPEVRDRILSLFGK
ncbi:polyketide synthase [Bacillus paralicheniformis]|uniref:polyketide synthase n=1 Tax=Bacillus paralicheniformis TaxID=1648923 RepID=UPI000D023D44|nr:polyketide synthase [Bacillus paralicheniformis]